MSSKQDGPTPEHLFARFVEQHDLEALGQLFDQLGPGLLQVAGRLGRDEHDAADTLQETFLALVERRSHFDPDRTLVPWIVGILINKSRDLSRRRELRGADAQAASDSTLHPATPESDRPEERLARFELGHALDAALADLPADQRSAVASRLFDGTPGPAVATAEGITQGALRVRLHRGRELLQRALAPVAATWFGATLLGWLGLSTTRSTLVQAKRHVLRRASLTTSGKSTAAATATRLAPKLLVTAVVATAALTIALEFGGSTAPKPTQEPIDLARTEAAAPLREDLAVPLPSDRAEADAPATEAAALERFTARVLTLADNQPLEGQLVRLTTGSYQTPTFHDASTDAGGRATFELPPDARLLFVRALPTSTTTSNRVWINRLPEGTRNIDLFVGLGASLSGTVLDPDDQPVPFAEVRVWCNSRYTGPGPDRTIKANASGQFILEHIGPDVIITARAEGLACSQGLLGTLVEGRAESGAKLYLEPAVTRTGIVLDPDGAPIEGASVLFRDGLSSSSGRDLTSISGITTFRAGSGEAETGPDGRFAVVGLPVSDTYCEASAFPFRKAEAHFQRDSDEPLTVQLTRAQLLAGVVVDEKGQPIEGAHLRAWPYGGGSPQGGTATSDERGAFRIEGLAFQKNSDASAPTLITRHEGCAVHFQQPVQPNDTTLSIQLLPERSLRGRITTHDLETVEGMRVWVLSDHVVERSWISPTPSTWEGLTSTHETTTDKNGEFAFAELNPGALRLFVSHPIATRVEIEFAIGPAEQSLELTLDEADFPMVHIEGVITDASTGKPLLGVYISAEWERTPAPGTRSSGSFSRLAESDAAGHFTIPGLPPGSIELWLTKPGYSRFSLDLGALGAGFETLKTALKPERSLQVLLRDEATSKVREGQLRLFDSHGKAVSIQAGGFMSSGSIHSRGGEAFLHGVPAEPLLLTVTSSGTEVTVPVDLTKPTDQPLTVWLPTPAPPPPPKETVGVSWMFLELTSPLTKREVALFEPPINIEALRPWFLEQKKSGRIDTPQHTFSVTITDAFGQVFNQTTLVPTLHGDLPPTYTITEKAMTAVITARVVFAHQEPGIEMADVPQSQGVTTLESTIEDARAAFISASAPVGPLQITVTSADYEPLTLSIDIESGREPGMGDMLFLTPR